VRRGIYKSKATHHVCVYYKTGSVWEGKILPPPRSSLVKNMWGREKSNLLLMGKFISVYHMHTFCITYNKI
jgi:hypothetical protein